MFFLFTCKSVNYKNLDLRLTSSTDSIAVFSIHEKDYGSILPAPLAKAAVKWEKNIDLSTFVPLLSYKKSVLSSENWDQLIKEEELSEIQILLSKSILSDPAYGYLVLLKREDPLSPLLKILRSSFLIIKTEGGYIFAIPDLNQNLTFNTQYKFDDWSLYQIPKIRSSIKQEIKIKPNQINLSIYREEVGDNVKFYDRIIIFEDLKYLPNPLLFRTPDIDEIETKKQKNDVIERLKTLEELKRNQLLTDEEYRDKKKEILKDL